LRIQADAIRIKRFMRAEKLANEAPVKMLFPLVAFIFPVVFLIMLGPIIARMFHSVF
jgi:tight adherence protein C